MQIEEHLFKLFQNLYKQNINTQDCPIKYGTNDNLHYPQSFAFKLIYIKIIKTYQYLNCYFFSAVIVQGSSVFDYEFKKITNLH